MNRSFLLIALFSSVFYFPLLTGQDKSPDKVFKEKYFNNEDFKIGDELQSKGKILESIPHLKKAIATFLKEENWKAYIRANDSYINTWTGSEEFWDGISVGKEVLKKVEAESPHDYKYCHLILDKMAKIAYRSFETDTALFYILKREELIKTSDLKEKEYWLASLSLGKGAALVNLGRPEEARTVQANVEKILVGEPGSGKPVILKSNGKYQSEDQKYLRTLSGALVNLGATYRMMGNYEKGLEYLDKGFNLYQQMYSPNSLKMVMPYRLKIDYFADIGESVKAGELAEKCLYIIESSGTDAPFFLGYRPQLYRLIAGRNEQSEQFEKALENYQKVIDYAGENQLLLIDKVFAYIHSSGIILSQGNIEKAKDYLDRASEFFTQNKIETGLGNISMQKDLNNYYALLFEQSRDLKKALEYYKRSYDLPFMEGDRKTWHKASTAINVSKGFLALENYDSSKYYNQIALNLLSNEDLDLADLELPNPSSVKPNDLVYDLVELRIAVLNEMSEKQQKQSEKSSYLSQLTQTINFFDKVHSKNVAEINAMRAGETKQLISKSINIYWSGVAFLNDINLSFYYAQKLKSQQLRLQLLKSEAGRFAGIDEKLLEKEKALLTDINYYEKSVNAAEKEGKLKKAQILRNDFIFPKKEEYEELQRELEVHYPEFYKQKYNFEPESVDSLQALLNAGETIVEYVLNNNVLIIFILKNGKEISRKKIKLQEGIIDRIKKYRKMISGSPGFRSDSRKRFISISNDLYRQFLQPIESQFAGKERIIIIGDGMTNYIPFETLLQTDEIKPFNELNFLIKNHEISYHYSSTLFAKARREKAEMNTGIYAFAPVYDFDIAGSVSANFRSDSTLRAFVEDGSFAPLPESEREVNSIFQLFNKKSKNTGNALALRTNANESNLKENLEKPYQFIHIAGHSFADVKNPKFSGIACYKTFASDSVEIAKGNDGTLYTGEIYNLSSAADLVTLSSCESGFGKLEKTEGLLGLNRAFIYAGTPNVVFSLWKVYDKVSAQLMVDFYENILEGKDYSESLRAGKLELLKDKRTAAPHFWSPYLLIGR